MSCNGSSTNGPTPVWTNKTTNTKYGTWADIQTGQKNFVQFGVEVENDSGSVAELAMVTLRLDRKS